MTRTCVACGSPVVARQRELTEKKRSKFGVIWLLVTLVTFGLGFLLWLVWPRHKIVIGVDRWAECSTCGARQP